VLKKDVGELVQRLNSMQIQAEELELMKEGLDEVNFELQLQYTALQLKMQQAKEVLEGRHLEIEQLTKENEQKEEQIKELLKEVFLGNQQYDATVGNYQQVVFSQERLMLDYKLQVRLLKERVQELESYILDIEDDSEDEEEEEEECEDTEEDAEEEESEDEN
jgi:structural maintenance of chromosome 4